MTTSHASDAEPRRRPRLRGRLAGTGAAACAICCAAPLMTLLGIGVTGAGATALAAAFAGAVFALVVAAATVVAVVMSRRQARFDACATDAPGPVAVELGPRPSQSGPDAS